MAQLVGKELEARLAKLDKIEQRDKKYAAKQQLLLLKARQAGITVTDKEIEEYLAKNKKK